MSKTNQIRTIMIILTALLIAICISVFPPIAGYNQPNRILPVIKGEQPVLKAKETVAEGKKEVSQGIKKIQEEREQDKLLIAKLQAENIKLKETSKEDKNNLATQAAAIIKERNKNKYLLVQIEKYLIEKDKELEYEVTSTDSAANYTSTIKISPKKPIKKETIVTPGPLRIDSVESYRSGFLGIFGKKKYKNIHE